MCSSDLSPVKITPEALGWDTSDSVFRERLERAVSRGGMQGKALQQGKKWPTKREVLDKIPEDCFKKDTLRSMLYATSSLVQVLGFGYLAWRFLPMTWSALPLWMLYAVIQGTLGTGPWVIGHECGHNAFCDQKWLQTLVGYTFHTALMVPYFSWQRSHAVHHARTNHMTEGETHVPRLQKTATNKYDKMEKFIGRPGVGLIRMITHLAVGWPAYILTGATGGPKYGVTSHLWPYAPFNSGQLKLFPGKQLKHKVLKSDVGLIAMCALLTLWAQSAGWAAVTALYIAPVCFTNMWLVLYTWLQHTDVDVPHFSEGSWTWTKGAFHTIDRPYGRVLDFIHHRIGSTHVAHHVNSAIPHYKAVKATEALKNAFPDLYLYDPTPIHKALWRVSTRCTAVKETSSSEGMYVFA